MRIYLLALPVLFLILFSSSQSGQSVFEGTWINIDYHQAIEQHKGFEEWSKLNYNFLYLKDGKVSMEYRFEQTSDPEKIRFTNKDKTEFRYLDFSYKYESDTIYMSSETKTVAKFIKYK